MAGSALIQYDTRGVPSKQRLAFWNDLVSQNLGPMVIDSPVADDFQARLTHLPLGDREITSAWSSASEVQWRAPLAEHEPLDALRIEFQFKGTSRLLHCGREAVLDTGDFVLLDPSRSGHNVFDAPVEALIIRVPRQRLIERLGDVEPILGLRVPGYGGAGAMLSAFVSGTWARVGTNFDPAWAHAVGDVILSLVDLAYAPFGRETKGRLDTMAASQDRALQIVESRLCSPDFTARDISVALGVSARYVQMLFARLGVTPTVYILDRRLDLAAERLQRSPSAGSVSSVAFSVGFNDLSYFCRAFRRRFGVSPSRYAQRRLT